MSSTLTTRYEHQTPSVFLRSAFYTATDAFYMLLKRLILPMCLQDCVSCHLLMAMVPAMFPSLLDFSIHTKTYFNISHLSKVNSSGPTFYTTPTALCIRSLLKDGPYVLIYPQFYSCSSPGTSFQSSLCPLHYTS